MFAVFLPNILFRIVCFSSLLQQTWLFGSRMALASGGNAPTTPVCSTTSPSQRFSARTTQGYCAM